MDHWLEGSGSANIIDRAIYLGREGYFLAAMSNSRSDVVTQFVFSCFRVSVFLSVPFFFLLVSLKFLLVLKSFNGVSKQFKQCLKFNGSFKAVSRKF